MKGMLKFVPSTDRPGMGCAWPGSSHVERDAHSMDTHGPLDAALITLSIGHSGNAAEACTHHSWLLTGQQQSKSINVCGCDRNKGHAQ